METLSVEQRVEICQRVFGAVRFTLEVPERGVMSPPPPMALFPTRGYQTLPDFDNYLDFGLVAETMIKKGFLIRVGYFLGEWLVGFFGFEVTNGSHLRTGEVCNSHPNLATAAALAALEAMEGD